MFESVNTYLWTNHSHLTQKDLKHVQLYQASVFHLKPYCDEFKHRFMRKFFIVYNL